MKNVNAKGWPFRVFREDSRDLTVQTADGLRRAMRAGAFKKTGRLPSYEEIAATLGVSRNVVRAAVRSLREEGLVKSRSRIGTVVLASRDHAWRGRVLLVIPDNDYGYYKNLFIGVIRNRLLTAGYMVLTVCVPETSLGEHDFRLIDYMLETSFDLAFLMYGRQGIEQHLSAAGVPYVVCSGRKRMLPYCVGWVRQSEDFAIPDFMRECLAAGVKKVTRVWCWSGVMEIDDAFAETGICIENLEVPLDQGRYRTIEGVQLAAMEFFMKLCGSKREFPDVYLFTDDYLTSGAMSAFAHHGIKIPEDVGVVTLSNVGLGPVYLKPFTRLEMDAEKHGLIVADAIMTYLEKGCFQENLSIGSVYVQGDTFPQQSCSGRI